MTLSRDILETMGFEAVRTLVTRRFLALVPDFGTEGVVEPAYLLA